MKWGFLSLGCYIITSCLHLYAKVSIPLLPLTRYSLELYVCYCWSQVAILFDLHWITSTFAHILWYLIKQWKDSTQKWKERKWKHYLRQINLKGLAHLVRESLTIFTWIMWSSAVQNHGLVLKFAPMDVLKCLTLLRFLSSGHFISHGVPSSLKASFESEEGPWTFT
jgi:hypothetical protein